MKKIIAVVIASILSCLPFVSYASKNSVAASFTKKERVSDIGVNFERIKRVSNGHLISYYSDEELYEKAIKPVMSRKGFGTRTSTLSTAKISFRFKTLDIISNLGEKEITQEIEIKQRTHSKFLFSFARNSKYDLKATPKGFSANVNKSLGINTEYTLDVEQTKSNKTKITIEPGVKMTRSVEGVGSVINGGIAKYIFWVRHYFGTYEYCLVNSYYEKIVKEKVYEK